MGEQVARDEPLFEVSTDKVDSEVPSPAEGVLAEILVPEGDTVDVGARLAVIGGDGAGGAGAPADDGNPRLPRPRARLPPPRATAAAPAPRHTPPHRRRPAPSSRAGTGAGRAQRIVCARGRVHGHRAPPVSSGNGQVLSPVVRKLMNENGIDPSQVTGTGLGGRITRDDV